MNLRWIVLFAAVADEGSFTRAAIRLNIAQPWLSAQLRKLEFELGLKLFERVSAGVELTQQGRQLLPYARQISEASRKFREASRTMESAQSHVVRIGSQLPMVGIPPLRGLNDDFVRRHPHFSLRAEAATTQGLLQDLQEGRLDFVAALWPIADEDLYEIRSLAPIQPYIVVPRDSALGRLGRVDTDLSAYEIATPPMSSQPAFYDRLLAPLRDVGASFRPVPEMHKLAMEHFARIQGAAVVMIEGKAEDYANDADLMAIALPGTDTEHVLVRIPGRDMQRAAERYWALATTAFPAKGSVPKRKQRAT
jgi:DNA-binding transcriptional LysR family regulator